MKARTRQVIAKEIGKLRIYLTPAERLPSEGLRQRLFPRYLYKELIRLSKQAGIRNATVHQTTYGYSNGGVIHAPFSAEVDNPHLNLYVELIDDKDSLWAFCQTHHVLLHGKFMVYKHLEHWDFADEHLVQTDALDEDERNQAL